MRNELVNLIKLNPWYYKPKFDNFSKLIQEHFPPIIVEHSRDELYSICMQEIEKQQLTCTSLSDLKNKIVFFLNPLPCMWLKFYKYRSEYIRYIFEQLIRNSETQFIQNRHIIYASKFNPCLQNLIFDFKKQGAIKQKQFQNKPFYILTINVESNSRDLQNYYIDFHDRMVDYLNKHYCAIGYTLFDD